MALSEVEAQSFFAEPHVAVISIATGSAPLAVPIWYDYEPGGDAWIATGTNSIKARRLRAAGAATLVVHTVAPRTRYVSVQCDLVAEEESSLEHTRRMAARYLPPEQAAAFLAYAESTIGAEARFVLRPRRWLSADLTLE